MPVQAIGQITSTVIAGGVAIKGAQIIEKSLKNNNFKTKKLKGSSFVDVYVQTKNMQAAIELNDPKKQWKGAIADIKKKYNYDPTKR